MVVGRWLSATLFGLKGGFLGADLGLCFFHRVRHMELYRAIANHVIQKDLMPSYARPMTVDICNPIEPAWPFFM